MNKKKLVKEFGQKVSELDSNTFKYATDAATCVIKKSTFNSVDMHAVCAVGVLGIVGVAFIWYIRHTRKKKVKGGQNEGQKDYVFFSSDGTPLTLSEKDVLTIKQMCNDSVLPSVIADEYGIKPVMVCRIANGIEL